MNGVVHKFNITARLLYKLQGEIYLNPDVVLDIRTVHIEDAGTRNRVRVFGVKGSSPSPTTKVMVVAKGGFQVEATYYVNGLDVNANIQMMMNQLDHLFGDSQFCKFSAEVCGKQVDNPSSQ